VGIAPHLCGVAALQRRGKRTQLSSARFSAGRFPGLKGLHKFTTLTPAGKAARSPEGVLNGFRKGTASAVPKKTSAPARSFAQPHPQQVFEIAGPHKFVHLLIAACSRRGTPPNVSSFFAVRSSEIARASARGSWTFSPAEKSPSRASAFLVRARLQPCRKESRAKRAPLRSLTRSKYSPSVSQPRAFHISLVRAHPAVLTTEGYATRGNSPRIYAGEGALQPPERRCVVFVAL
jgi:hypothetical protein